MGPKHFPNMGHLDALVALQIRVAKKFASECGSKMGIMRGFPKGMTLGGRTPRSFHMVGLQKIVAKKFAQFLHLSCDPCRGS